TNEQLSNCISEPTFTAVIPNRLTRSVAKAEENVCSSKLNINEDGIGTMKARNITGNDKDFMTSLP
ncbi:MAG: hypothetical protein SVK08_07395, partial [Halobacteriota archaeon]|nr:hypothetical protein [Halobacteriota archaeon]